MHQNTWLLKSTSHNTGSKARYAPFLFGRKGMSISSLYTATLERTIETSLGEKPVFDRRMIENILAEQSGWQNLKLSLPCALPKRAVQAEFAREFVQNMRLAWGRLHYEQWQSLAQTAVIMQVNRITLTETIGTLPGAEEVKLILPEKEQLTEHYRVGDTLAVYVQVVKSGKDVVWVRVSRTDPNLTACLLAEYLPKPVTISRLWRMAGEYSKVRLSEQYRLTHSQLNLISGQLGGESVQILPDRRDTKTFLRAAFEPAEVELVQLDYRKRRATIRVDQPVRLGQLRYLTGWHFTIVE
jgi:transcription antitermination factor NusA-like protein